MRYLKREKKLDNEIMISETCTDDNNHKANHQGQPKCGNFKPKTVKLS